MCAEALARHHMQEEGQAQQGGGQQEEGQHGGGQQQQEGQALSGHVLGHADFQRLTCHEAHSPQDAREWLRGARFLVNAMQRAGACGLLRWPTWGVLVRGSKRVRAHKRARAAPPRRLAVAPPYRAGGHWLLQPGPQQQLWRVGTTLGRPQPASLGRWRVSAAAAAAAMRARGGPAVQHARCQLQAHRARRLAAGASSGSSGGELL